MSEARPSAMQLGGDIRALRKARQMTIGAVAQALGKSVGWLSQVERGMSRITNEELETLAALFAVPLPLLLPAEGAEPAERGYIVRAGQRRRMGSRSTDLVEELLAPDLTGDVQALHATFAPRAAHAIPPNRDVEEIGYILSGRLIVTIDGTRHDLRRGDSVRLRGDAYTWENPTANPTTAIWITTPPFYIKQ